MVCPWYGTAGRYLLGRRVWETVSSSFVDGGDGIQGRVNVHVHSFSRFLQPILIVVLFLDHMLGFLNLFS